MLVIDPGHLFALNNYSGNQNQSTDSLQELEFMKRIGTNYPGNTGPEHDGTNCQEVLRALISRTIYLNKQIPCIETKSAIYYLRRALFAFELRAARIKGAKLPEDISLDRIEDFPACHVCGHIYLHKTETCKTGENL